MSNCSIQYNYFLIRTTGVTCTHSQHNRRHSHSHLTMFARRAVTRLAPNAQRSMSTATPKTHKAKDVWAQIEATRPKDPHPHVRCWVLLLLVHDYSYCSTVKCDNSNIEFNFRKRSWWLTLTDWFNSSPLNRVHIWLSAECLPPTLRQGYRRHNDHDYPSYRIRRRVFRNEASAVQAGILEIELPHILARTDLPSHQVMPCALRTCWQQTTASPE